MQKRRSRGFLLRDAFAQDLRGMEWHCKECHKPGVLGKDLYVAYMQADTLIGRDYSVWALCKQCQDLVTLTRIRASSLPSRGPKYGEGLPNRGKITKGFTSRQRDSLGRPVIRGGRFGGK